MDKNTLYKYFIGHTSSRTTIDNHINKILRINSISDIKYNNVIDLLNDSSNIIKLINKKYSNIATKKSFFISLVSFCKTIINSNKNLIDEKHIQKYYNHMLKFRDINNKEINNNTKNKKQKQNWVSWEELQKVPSIIKPLIFSKDNTPFKIYEIYTKYIITCLYTMIPPLRLDYHKIHIFKKKSDVKIYKDYDRYIILEDGIMKLNKFKNVKKIGKQTIKLPNELKDIISKYYQFLIKNNYPHEFLLYSPRTKKEFSSNSFGKYVQKIFELYINKSVDVNMIRHSYSNFIVQDPNYNNLSINEKEKLHRQILHSKNVGEEYVKLDKNKKNKDISMKEAKEILLKMGYTLKNT